jgi:hypothetical protein
MFMYGHYADTLQRDRKSTITVHIISVSGSGQQVIHQTQFRKTSLIFLQCFI